MMLTLKPGSSYLIKKIQQSVDKNYRYKLLSMGMVPGAIFKVVRMAPLGDTIQIFIKDYALSLRSKELSHLSLEAIY